ncbi:MAG TPA: protein kinase, partial [Acidobacteriota bacterium]|nr:protein kinase [Acidobacteriota bacterium]
AEQMGLNPPPKPNSDQAPALDLTGRILLHYRIIEKIGEGGMGVIYKARDAHLDRTVAIKVLPAEAMADTERKRRFVQEAKTASALNHPNIIDIHDINSDGGVDFIAMEYVEGKTLDRRIWGKGIRIGEALKYAIQIADALAAAHAAGIVHRDLKPANIMVTETGLVKVLDFGLAKLMQPIQSEVTGTVPNVESLTGDGRIMGTVAYMSPEQAEGKPVNAPSDIFSFGAVLYEMITGHRAFEGDSNISTLAAVLHAKPEPVSRIITGIPSELERIIDKALEKDRELRYQNASDLVADLRRLQRDSESGRPIREPTGLGWKKRRVAVLGAAITIALCVLLVLSNVGGLRNRLLGRANAPDIRSLAVLPLTNLSGDSGQEYFADGMTDALISELGSIQALRVISRTSVMRYKGTQKSLQDIGRDLKVDTIIEGSVLRSGSRVRVTARLVEAQSERRVWAGTYENDLRDVLGLQGKLAQAIAEEVGTKLTPQERTRLASARQVDPGAYDAYLMGRLHWYKATPQGLDTALEYFRLAQERDPNNALAYVGIGFVWAMRAHTGILPAGEGWSKARVAAVKALELDDTLAEAHDLLATVLTWYEWKWAAGEREYRRAIEINPNYANARCFYSFFLHAMRRSQEARGQVEKALELDPYNPFFHMALAVQLINEGRPDEALAPLYMAAKMQPDSLFIHNNLWAAFHQKGKYEEAMAEAKQYFALHADLEVVQALDRGYAHGGYRNGMRQAADTLATQSKRTSVNPMDVAELYACAGEKDRALDWLEESYEERSSQLPYIGVDRLLEPLRSDPRYQDLLRRMNLAQ